MRGLPQTFRDAVTLAKVLAIKYLWIDSLCTIQDSLEDWARECSRMTDVYLGYFVNVAAKDSTDSDGGLFRNRDPLAVTPLGYIDLCTNSVEGRTIRHAPL